MRLLALALACLLTGCAAKPTWEKPLPEAPAGPLAGSGDRLCYVAKDGAAYGLDPKDGAQKWKFAPSKLAGKYPPVFVGKYLCLLGEGGIVYGVDPKDGKKKWSSRQPGAVGPTAAGDDYVAVQSNSGLTLLDASSGEVVKHISLGGFFPIGVAPAFTSGSVFVVKAGPPPNPDDRLAEKTAALHGFLCPSLTETWMKETGEGTGLAAEDDLVVYLCTMPRTGGSYTQTEAYDRQSGKSLWSGYEPPVKAAATGWGPCLARGQVVLGMSTGLDSFLVSLKGQATAPQENWHFQFPINASGGVICTAPIVSHDLAIMGQDNRVVAVSRDTGSKKWALEELEGTVVRPVVVGDMLYVATDKKHLYAKQL